MEKMKKKNRIKRGLAIALSAAMVLGVMPSIGGGLIEVQAADTTTVKNVNWGTVGIGNPTEVDGMTAWTGSKVYFGLDTSSTIPKVDENNDIADTPDYTNKTTANNLWRVLDASAGLLFADDIIAERRYDNDTINWASSELNVWLNGDTYKKKSGKFSTLEQGAIATNTDGDIRLLTIDEVKNTAYGFTNDELSNTARAASSGWWLRSPVGGASNVVAGVYADGRVSSSGDRVYRVTYSVRPVFNLNLDSVLFTSASEATKSDFNLVGTDHVAANTWKLTLKDTDTSFVATLPTSGVSGSAVTVNITTAGSGSVAYNQTSAMLVDSSNNVVAYGKIGDASIDEKKTFTIPSTVPAGNYTLKVFPEQVNGATKTDYAGKVVEGEINIVTGIPSVTITGINEPVVGEALSTESVCAITGVATTAPTVTWTPEFNIKDGKATYNTVYTASVTLTAADGYAFTSATTAQIGENSAKVVLNNDRTITVSYTYSKTATREVSNAYFATVDDLKECYSLNESGKIVGKIIFGQNGQTGENAAPQEWKIAGNDAGIAGDNIILFAASPLGSSKFVNDKSADKYYDSGWNCTYTDDMTGKEVSPNHYGRSDLRSTLNGYMSDGNTSYFSSSEKSMMNPTKIYTADGVYGINYSTTDILYAPYGDSNFINENFITVGTNSSENLNGALQIDKSNWGDKDKHLWLRSPYRGGTMALVAKPDVYVDVSEVELSELVVPAFDLNLSSVLFASAATPASEDYSGYIANDTENTDVTENADNTENTMTANTFTLRYAPGLESALANATATISLNGSKVTITGETENMYLVAQNDDGVSIADITDVNNSGITVSGTTTSVDISAMTGIDSFSGCKVWLESTDQHRITTAKMATQETASVTITNPENSHISRAGTTGNGADNQSGFTGAMQSIVYTADEGYYFPENYVSTITGLTNGTLNGVTVTRDNAGQITVSGTPTVTTVNITLPAATITPTVDDTPVVSPTNIKVTKLTLNKSTLTLTENKTSTLKVTVTPTNATNKKVTWKSSNKKVATVSATGKITAIKAGKTTITCTAADGSGIKATCKVTVKEATSKKQEISIGATTKGTKVKVTWVKIEGADGYYIYGAKCGETPKKLKTIKSGKTTSWTQTGLEKGAVYKYTVKAYKKSGKKIKNMVSSIQLHIATDGSRYTNAKKVKTTFSSTTLNKGKTKQIKASIVKEDNAKPLVEHTAKYRYLTSNKKIATVSATGKIKAKKKGTCYVYVYANDGVSKKIRVVVK